MLETIRNYLISKGITDTIYIGFRPAAPNNAITLYHTAGLAPDPKHQYNSIGMQVYSRGENYQTAYNLAYSIFTILQSASSVSNNTTLQDIISIEAQQDPYSLGNDELSRAQFVQNYIISYYRELENRN